MIGKNLAKTRNLKLLVLAGGLFFFLHPLHAQTDNQKNSQSIRFSLLGTFVPGQIIDKEGTIRKGRIRYDNPDRLIRLSGQLEVYFMGMEASTLVDKETISSFTIDGHTWKRILFNGDEQFGIMHLDGTIKNYSVFKIPFIRETGDYIEEMYWQKRNEKPIKSTVFMMKYRKTLTSLISDYPELLQKVNNGERGYKGILNVEKVIREYNEWAAAEDIMN